MAATSPSPAQVAGSVRVREVHRHDLDAYRELAVENAGELDKRVGLLDRFEEGVRFLRRPPVWLLLRVLRGFGRAPLRLLAAEDQGTLVGSTITMLVGPWAYVAAVGVRADHRRRGIAALLMAHAEEIGRRSGRDLMVLEVDSENEPARRLYAGLGWRAGLRSCWWELPVRPTAGDPPRARRAHRTDCRRAHAASAAQLGYEFPEGSVHPCELVCRGLGGWHETFAAGPVGAPSLVVRAWAGKAGQSGFLVPVAIGTDPGPDEARVLEAGRAALAGAGSVSVFVPVLGASSRLDDLLRSAGGTPGASSEFWSKEVPHPRAGPVPTPWAVASDRPPREDRASRHGKPYLADDSSLAT